MKKETFDIPAYNFAIAFSKEPIHISNYEKYIEELKKHHFNNEIILVPFENFDGLTIGEVLDYTERKGFIFLCYIKWPDNVHAFRFFEIYCANCMPFKHERDFRLDKFIEEYLQSIYNHTSQQNQKMCRCFFERYQDRTHQETVERVKRLSIKK